jgi:hypothetical protein
VKTWTGLNRLKNRWQTISFSTGTLVQKSLGGGGGRHWDFIVWGSLLTEARKTNKTWKKDLCRSACNTGLNFLIVSCNFRFVRLKIWTSNELLWKRKWTFGFHKRRGIF